ncbi:MAG TPA: hypothetical protein ENK76_03675 [Campylobacterales bacterium]|nr:hypothetical protein [Campylobacterales bacterium]
MFKITVDKECGCFRKSDLENNKSFGSKDDALIEAQNMVNSMNSDFCGKHNFILREDGANFSISMDVPQQQTHSGCCGGGHCS